jgi:hypothetical protein
VFSAADIIEALGLRRRLKSIRPDIPGQLPPGWQSWLDGMSATPRAVVGAAPQDVITEFVHRELAQPPPRVANLNRWQAFATLWRQQWQGPEPEERGLRWFAAIFSAILHPGARRAAVVPRIRAPAATAGCIGWRDRGAGRIHRRRHAEGDRWRCAGRARASAVARTRDARRAQRRATA